MVAHVLSDLTHITLMRKKKHLLTSLREKEGNAVKRALARLLVVCIKGTFTWVSCQVLSPREKTQPKLWMDTMGR